MNLQWIIYGLLIVQKAGIKHEILKKKNEFEKKKFKFYFFQYLKNS